MSHILLFCVSLHARSHLLLHLFSFISSLHLSLFPLLKILTGSLSGKTKSVLKCTCTKSNCRFIDAVYYDLWWTPSVSTGRCAHASVSWLLYCSRWWLIHNLLLWAERSRKQAGFSSTSYFMLFTRFIIRKYKRCGSAQFVWIINVKIPSVLSAQASLKAGALWPFLHRKDFNHSITKTLNIMN